MATLRQSFELWIQSSEYSTLFEAATTYRMETPQLTEHIGRNLPNKIATNARIMLISFGELKYKC